MEVPPAPKQTGLLRSYTNKAGGFFLLGSSEICSLPARREALPLYMEEQAALRRTVTNIYPAGRRNSTAATTGQQGGSGASPAGHRTDPAPTKVGGFVQRSFGQEAPLA